MDPYASPSNIGHKKSNFRFEITMRELFTLFSAIYALKCDNNEGIISLNEKSSPFNASELGEVSDTCSNSDVGCYTLLLVDNNGELVLQNGCHSDQLGFYSGLPAKGRIRLRVKN